MSENIIDESNNNDVETMDRELGNLSEWPVVGDESNKKLLDGIAILEKERKAFMKERDAIKKDRDDIKKDRDDIKTALDVITEDRDAIWEDRDAIKYEKIEIKKDRNAIKKKMESLKDIKDAVEQKYTALTSKLCEQVECPVCLEVPTSGPVHVCPNGHFVCSKCKDANCPTCRGRMFAGKSLLAVTVIENIEHRCKYEECEELLPLEEYNLHLKMCPQRIVRCPGPEVLCGKKMSLCKVYDHILSECKGSWNARSNIRNDDFTKFLSYPVGTNQFESNPGFALCWKGVYFYLCFEKVPPYNVFSVQLFGNALECKDYVVNISLHRIDDLEMKGNHVQKFSGEPLPIDMEQEVKNVNGLNVGSIQMEKLVMKKKSGDSEILRIGITVDISRNKSNV